MITLIHKEKDLIIDFEKDLTLLSLTYKDTIWDQVSQLSGYSIIVNFQHVNFIDSAGIEFLMKIVFQLKKDNTILFCNTSPYVQELIELSELNSLLQ